MFKSFIIHSFDDTKLEFRNGKNNICNLFCARKRKKLTSEEWPLSPEAAEDTECEDPEKVQFYMYRTQRLKYNKVHLLNCLYIDLYR